MAAFKKMASLWMGLLLTLTVCRSVQAKERVRKLPRQGRTAKVEFFAFWVR